MGMREMGRSALHIGTSGWHYDHWQGTFYPSELNKGQMLDYYAGLFHTVEINNSFYQLPSEETLRKWRQGTPDGFLFAVKASRYITHMKKLKDPEEPVSNFLERVEVLGEKLGPIIFQLPPRWKFNPERFHAFLETLPGGHSYAFEFRDDSWFDQRVYQELEEHGMAFCIYELSGRISPKKVTADFVYIRLHGPGGPYQGKYDNRVLAGWAGALSAWLGKGKEIYCYFDNDEKGFAAQNALSLKDMAEKAESSLGKG